GPAIFAVPPASLSRAGSAGARAVRRAPARHASPGRSGRRSAARSGPTGRTRHNRPDGSPAHRLRWPPARSSAGGRIPEVVARFYSPSDVLCVEVSGTLFHRIVQCTPTAEGSRHVFQRLVWKVPDTWAGCTKRLRRYALARASRDITVP